MEAIAIEQIREDLDERIKALYLDPQGYTYDEIARFLGVSRTRVQKRLHAMCKWGEIELNRGKGFRSTPLSVPSSSQFL